MISPVEATSPGAALDIPGAPNLRDLGGWPTASGGRVAIGCVFRSAELNALDGEGAPRFASLGVRTVYDLRTVAERDAQPDRLPEGTSSVHLDVLADAPGNAAAHAADLPRLLGDPAALESLLGDGKVLALFDEAYRQVVTLPSARDSYRSMFTGLSDPSRRPALFHCTTGKDRTGWGAAALLSLLGVSRADIMADYLLTNTQILPLTQPMYDRFRAAGGDLDLLRPALGVDESYLRTAFDEMESTFGDIDSYFTDGLGLGADMVERLRRDLVE